MNWNALMVAPATDSGAAPILRAEFSLDADHGPAQSATLEATSYGVFEAAINGHAVTDDVLAPGWSSYQWRLRVATYDVLHLLRPVNVITLTIGNGWYRGRLTWNGARGLYGTERAGAAQIVIRYADGYEQTVASDETWRSLTGQSVSDDLYDGQHIDARLGEPSLDLPGQPQLGEPVVTVPLDTTTIVPFATPPIRRQEELGVRDVLPQPDGSVILDFGQNIVGWLRVTVTGPRGHEIVVRHAEVLDGGELALRPLRSAQATDRYVLSGEADVFEPTFTFHGFRYAQIFEWPGVFDEKAVSAIVVHSDIRRVGSFTSSDPLLNRLHENVVWGLRGNFVGIPSDCPQRDERLGWTGDIAVFAPTSAYLFDVQAFLGDWLDDLALEQAHSGDVPEVVPYVLGEIELPFTDYVGTTAIWSDAAVWVPYALWQAYGDADVISRAYESMTRHTRRVAALLSPSGLWDTGFQFGDWLDPTASPDAPWEAQTDNGVVATACAFRTATFLAEMAEAVGNNKDAEEFSDLANRVRRAFLDAYVDAGRVTSDSATAYALAIAFGILDGDDRANAGNRLAELVAAADYRVTTGFAGTPYVCEALSSTGHLDAAYLLLTETGMPSWLYPVTMGATTIWERWDSMLPDGTINPGEMTSFNHYALGSVAQWMHQTITGIRPLTPGYAKALIAPRPGGGLTSAEGTLETRHGRVAVAWKIVSDDFILTIEVPNSIQAEVVLPSGNTFAAPSGVSEHREPVVPAPDVQLDRDTDTPMGVGG
ncbi:MAG: ramA [Frondihabitans sp.]|nr:ramA [Frondihabitans sp.]